MEQREFKGVWIPREIWLDERLNMLEKGILAEIDSLDNENGCSAGNEYLANFCQCSETKVSTAIKKLIELDYIYVKSFDGRIRILKSRLSNFERQDLKNLKADIKKIKDNNIDYDNIRNIYNNKCPSLPKCTTLSTRRKTLIKARLKDYSIEQLSKVFEMAEQSDFLKGKNDRNWTANFDWLLNEANFCKVLDGNYANRYGGNAKFGTQRTYINTTFVGDNLVEEIKNLEKI